MLTLTIIPGMYHSGIGGGGFALARLSNGSYESIDFRETAPAAAFQDMFQGNVNGSVYGGLARYGHPHDIDMAESQKRNTRRVARP